MSKTAKSLRTQLGSTRDPCDPRLAICDLRSTGGEARAALSLAGAPVGNFSSSTLAFTNISHEAELTARAYEISEKFSTPRALAGVRARVPMGRVPEYFGKCLDQVYAASKTGAIIVDGQNIFLYHPRPDGDLDVAFCVGTSAAFNPIGSVEFITTPAGLAASTTHWGDYAGLRGAHDALQAWCRANNRQLAGPSWEVYGHWSNNPAELRTDIFYLLSAS